MERSHSEIDVDIVSEQVAAGFQESPVLPRIRWVFAFSAAQQHVQAHVRPHGQRLLALGVAIDVSEDNVLPGCEHPSQSKVDTTRGEHMWSNLHAGSPGFPRSAVDASIGSEREVASQSGACAPPTAASTQLP
jgi:hypothetical protein